MKTILFQKNLMPPCQRDSYPDLSCQSCLSWGYSLGCTLQSQRGYALVLSRTTPSTLVSLLLGQSFVHICFANIQNLNRNEILPSTVLWSDRSLQNSLENP